MKQRWYDKDPTVSLAVSLLKNSAEELKSVCSEQIVQMAKDHGIKLQKGILSKINNTFNRWYDEDKSLSDAMEYIRLASPSLRKEIAVGIIQLLEEAEKI